MTHDVHYENYRLTCLGELRAQVGIHRNGCFLVFGLFGPRSCHVKFCQGIAVGDTSMERKRMSSKRLKEISWSPLLNNFLPQREHCPGRERVRGSRDDDAAPPERPGDQEDASHAGPDAAEAQLRIIERFPSVTN